MVLLYQFKNNGRCDCQTDTEGSSLFAFVPENRDCCRISQMDLGLKSAQASIHPLNRAWVVTMAR